MHARIAHLRGNLLHNITTELARGYTSVTIEDLNVAGMLQLRALARHVSDAAFGQFRRQLGYKAAWYGTEVVVADRWFPSSKTCSGCGTINASLTPSDRVYDCGACGLVIDQDVNAEVNLARYTRHHRKPRRYQRPPDARPRLHPDEPGQEPTATSLHEGALGRNQHKTTRKVGRRLEGNQGPPPEGGWSREAGES
jgi:IS605 OrfB family transposase